KHLSRYTLLETNIWINYKPNEMMQQEIQRKNGKRSGLWMRDKKIFEREKILSRFVAQEIIATYDDQHRYYEHTLHSTYVKDKRFKTKYILGLYNSALLKFYYQKNNSYGGNIFPQVRISSLENLPIKIATTDFQDLIEKIVDKIIAAKKDDPTADTSELEKQIDHLVYKLYQLTYNEVKIIDPEFALTEQEYLDLP
ncbi:MAG: TaqI-like C-terminal specificity domain-containing protein, partial [Microcystis aeruginosa]